MLISQIPSALYAGQVVEGNAPRNSNRHNHYERRLAMNWSTSIPSALLNRHLSIVYFMVVDGEIMKIGQTSGSGGIRACLNFYTGAGFGDDGLPRFVINGLWREALAEGRRVDVYFIYMEPIEVSVPGLFGNTSMEVPVSAKGMEQNCLEQFHEVEGRYPAWNFQESGAPCPQHLFEAHSSYRLIRARDRA